ncbi:hypothetical protein CSA17_00425 [bacterium DOLJORAL78_65_58]|nr:MAG: hypothetical protein CSB20_13940 [bacterium DOLZORAL124_64_63]PIE76774.1 MAG: hypothetical protein CSA17_00425 [bacterium DOLJORAL78_65_58]
MATRFVEFRSKVSPLMELILWGTIVILVGVVCLTLLGPGAGLVSRGLIVLISAPTVLGLLWYRFHTLYRLTDTHLLIRSGPMRRSICLDEIISIKPNRNHDSAPALSFDRFLVRYRQCDTVSISPKDRRTFLRELADRAPHLVLEEGYLVVPKLGGHSRKVCKICKIGKKIGRP